MDNTEDEGDLSQEAARHFDFKNDASARKMFRDRFGFFPMFHTMEGKWRENFGPVTDGNQENEGSPGVSLQDLGPVTDGSPGISLQDLFDLLRRVPGPVTE